MEKIENIFQNTLQKFKEFFNKERKTTFFITLITCLIVHFQLYSLMITGPDTLLNSMYHRPDIWEAMLLRVGLDFIQIIKGNVVSPVLATLISSVLLGITVIIVLETLEIKNKYFKYITAFIFAVAPNISATLTFFYCSDAYILGMLLASLAVYLVKKYKNKRIILISGFLLAFAMGMYQTYLSVTMCLAVATLIIDLLNKKEVKQVVINALRYVIMGVIGIALFYLISHLVVFLKNLTVASYSGANKIGLSTLLSLPTLLPEAYQSFFNYYFNDNMIPNIIWGTNIFYIIIFAIMLISVIYIIVKNKIYKKISNTIFTLILIICLPICFGIIEITAPSVDIHILMACSMICIFPIFFKILEIMPKENTSKSNENISKLKTNILQHKEINPNFKIDNAKQNSNFIKICKYTVVICSSIIAWNYTWQDNASYISIKTMQNQAEATANRLVMQVEQISGYTPETPVLITGGLEKNSYFDRKNISIENTKIFDRSWGFISSNPTVWLGNQESWKKLIYEYIGANLNIVNQSDYPEIIESEEYKNMKNYPEEGSIKIIDNIIVIKIS